jgi:PIN domain nuclease of toxin-antitoxin system
MGYQVTAVLLDTHVVLWWLEGGNQISRTARTILQDPTSRVLVSAVSAWEIAIKYKAGKLEGASTLVSRFEAAIEEEHFIALPISIHHAVQAGMLHGKHKDPFDRMLIAQALAEHLPVLSTDACFDRYAVRRIW